MSILHHSNLIPKSTKLASLSSKSWLAEIRLSWLASLTYELYLKYWICSNKFSSFSIHVRNFRDKGKIWHNNTQQWRSAGAPRRRKEPKARLWNRRQARQNSSLKSQTSLNYWTRCRSPHRTGNWQWKQIHQQHHLAMKPASRWNMSTVSQIFLV